MSEQSAPAGAPSEDALSAAYEAAQEKNHG